MQVGRRPLFSALRQDTVVKVVANEKMSGFEFSQEATVRSLVHDSAATRWQVRVNGAIAGGERR